ncbi:class II aldolase/adducin family protein [Burkholderiaceae bacterium FT117]|uniref:class II aldolase/adducin family protein n=1 Tax=Zeimonas sediminis TaxID=2944268 RepID=UPI0023430AEA|nr:class II aldolase/adducin family protein [Zeimonas sediminis]MCM5570849.1 class II aldolase/adducin family protein [Zeimonas sediminis]
MSGESGPRGRSREPDAGAPAAPAAGTAGTAGRDPALVTENSARQAIVDCCLKMAALGLNTGRAGNVSLRWHRGGPLGAGMLVTPAATPYESMSAEDVVWMPLAASDEAAARGATTRPEAEPATAPATPPARRPSSEWRMHRDVYAARPEAGAIVHVHSPAATALACLPRVQRDGIPAFHYMVAVAGGADIRCAPYRSFGTAELSQAALEALRERRACLLANHGTVAFGPTLAAALELSNEVESLARMYATALQLGEPAILGDDEIAQVLQRFADYRRQ